MACSNGEIRCLAANDQGKEGGVFKCVDGYWDLLIACRSYEKCVSSPSPHCTWAKLRRDIFKDKNEVEAEVEGEGDGQVATPLACKEGELKCLAANDQGKDGGVFKCVNGMWDMFQDCRDYEKCVRTPTPHCTWAKKSEVRYF
jgi:hypothetical protein